MSGLGEAGATLLGGVLASERPLGGGDLSSLAAIELTDGRRAIVKGGPAPRTEAAMLRALRKSGAPAPDVFAVDDSVLVMEAISGGGNLSHAWSSVGAAVRQLHSETGERYGWEQDFAFGSVAIVNDWSDDWPAFWGRYRLLDSLPDIPKDLATRIEALANDLQQRLPASPRPALLHGDLWTGNVMVDGRITSGFIDPACFYGDREVDLAMLHLFGSPDDTFYAAYGALEPGFEDRRAIYTLWPALVHLRLFGSGYRGLVERLLDQCRV